MGSFYFFLLLVHSIQPPWYVPLGLVYTSIVVAINVEELAALSSNLTTIVCIQVYTCFRNVKSEGVNKGEFYSKRNTWSMTDRGGNFA